MTKTYGRIVCPRFGGAEVLTPATEVLRDALPGEVRIRVLAAGVSWADCMMRRGTYPDQPKPPFTPGYDIAGVIDQCGPGSLRYQPGEPVGALTIRGGYSEYVFLPEDEPVPLPPGLDAGDAVCLILNYVTAYQMLHRAVSLRAGDGILVHSAAGGVGTALLQLARLQNIRTFGTASAAKHELVSSLGAEPIDYRSRRFEDEMRRRTPHGVSAAFDSIGGWHWLRSGSCLKRGGAVVAYGSQGAGKVEDVAAGIVASLRPGRRFKFYSITGEKRKHPDQFRQDLSTLFELLAGRRIQPIVGARLPWREAARANEMLEQGSVSGKIVLTFE